MKFNKKQRDYLDKLVQESPTRMILSQKLTESEVNNKCSFIRTRMGMG